MRRGRPKRLLNVELLAVVWFDSDGSRLPARGVTKPPPSTAIGMINSRGLFLIGWVPPPLLFNDDCDSLLNDDSVSDSIMFDCCCCLANGLDLRKKAHFSFYYVSVNGK